MPLIIPSNSITGGYEVANSLRFDDGSSDNLTRTNGTPTSTQICTFSCWVKRANISRQRIFTVIDPSSTGNYSFLEFTAGNQLNITEFDGSSSFVRICNNFLRDVSAWYHIVISLNASGVSDANKVKIYINGVETSYASETNGSVTSLRTTASGKTFYMGTTHTTSLNLDAYLSEVCLIDGSQLDPTSFGEFDADTGIWKPIDVSGLTFGTNGFYLDFENSGSLGADVSGNGNNFTVNNLTSIDQTTDTPTNNYCTWNPLLIRTGRTLPTFSEGNLKCQHNDTGGNTPSWGTFLLNSGKWYWEVKVTSFGIMYCGIWQPGYNNADVSDALNGIVVYRWDGKKQAETAATAATYGDSWSVGDIIGVAVDVDTGTIWFSKNGVWQNSATQAEIEAGTTTNSAYTGKSFSTNSIIPAVSAYQFSGNSIVEANFGNPTFSISSGNSDGNGFGQFEYAPPSGYLALCTKNLATDG